MAGSETTATLLAGVTYLLLSNPSTLHQLTEEVRSTFADEGEINMTSVNKLGYMLACLNEAMRVYPPVPTGLPRVVPSSGRTILGSQVPGKVKTAMSEDTGGFLTPSSIDLRCYPSLGGISRPTPFHQPPFLPPGAIPGRPPFRQR